MRMNLDNALRVSSRVTIQKGKKIVCLFCILACGTEHKQGCKEKLTAPGVQRGIFVRRWPLACLPGSAHEWGGYREPPM